MACTQINRTTIVTAAASSATTSACAMVVPSMLRIACGICMPTSTNRLPLSRNVDRSQNANAQNRDRARITRGP